MLLQREVGTIKAKQIADKKFMETLADIGEEEKNEEEILRQKKERYFAKATLSAIFVGAKAILLCRKLRW